MVNVVVSVLVFMVVVLLVDVVAESERFEQQHGKETSEYRATDEQRFLISVLGDFETLRDGYEQC